MTAKVERGPHLYKSETGPQGSSGALRGGPESQDSSGLTCRMTPSHQANCTLSKILGTINTAIFRKTPNKIGQIKLLPERVSLYSIVYYLYTSTHVLLHILAALTSSSKVLLEAISKFDVITQD